MSLLGVARPPFHDEAVSVSALVDDNEGSTRGAVHSARREELQAVAPVPPERQGQDLPERALP